VIPLPINNAIEPTTAAVTELSEDDDRLVETILGKSNEAGEMREERREGERVEKGIENRRVAAVYELPSIEVAVE
jgi:hypothetical protein